MVKSDFAPFSRMMALTAEQYGKPMSPELIRFYFDGLSDLTLEQVRAALNAHVRNTEVGQFMPKIADLVRFVHGTAEDAAYAALARVNRSFSDGKEHDDITRAVVRDLGGWRSIGLRDSEEWQSFGSKEFVKLYRLHSARAASKPALPDIEAPRLEEKPE